MSKANATMTTMTDVEGRTWRLGDLVLFEGKQGRIVGIHSDRSVTVQFPGSTDLMFVSGLNRIQENT